MRWFCFRRCSCSFARQRGRAGKRSCLPVRPHRSLLHRHKPISFSTQAAVCDPNSDEVDAAGCGSNFSYLFFPSFILICSFLVLNLFVAVIMDNFDYLIQDRSILGPHHLVSVISPKWKIPNNQQGDFVRAWGQFDPPGKGKLPQSQLLPLLRFPWKTKRFD